MKKRSKIIITTLSLITVMFVYYNIDYKYEPNYEIVGYVNDTKPYASYSNGDVYIIKNENKIKSLKLNETDIVIIDERHDDNPSMKVISSCNIRNKNEINEIIEIMKDYNTKYPSNWSRTSESLRLEWYVHNLLYDLNYKLDHTTDVDLDNNDEEEYNRPFFNKILKI